jgi:hypothetical protein
MCTTVGESAADFLNTNLNVGLTYTTLIMTGFLIPTLFFHRYRKYVPGVYWLAVVLISVVGTLITDNLTDNFGVSLVTTTIVFSVVLAAVFGAWYASEQTLSIHTIVTARADRVRRRGCRGERRRRPLPRLAPGGLRGSRGDGRDRGSRGPGSLEPNRPFRPAGARPLDNSPAKPA